MRSDSEARDTADGEQRDREHEPNPGQKWGPATGRDGATTSRGRYVRAWTVRGRVGGEGDDGIIQRIGAGTTVEVPSRVGPRLRHETTPTDKTGDQDAVPANVFSHLSFLRFLDLGGATESREVAAAGPVGLAAGAVVAVAVAVGPAARAAAVEPRRTAAEVVAAAPAAGVEGAKPASRAAVAVLGAVREALAAAVAADPPAAREV